MRNVLKGDEKKVMIVLLLHTVLSTTMCEEKKKEWHITNLKGRAVLFS